MIIREINKKKRRPYKEGVLKTNAELEKGKGHM
jgi:hypothetical protein